MPTPELRKEGRRKEEGRNEEGRKEYIMHLSDFPFTISLTDQWDVFMTLVQKDGRKEEN